MGPAELLIEATFTELRNGGRGDLTQTYKFAKKVRRVNSGISSLERKQMLLSSSVRCCLPRNWIRVNIRNSHFLTAGYLLLLQLLWEL